MLPAAGNVRPGLDGLGASQGGVEARAEAQRFDGEAGNAAEHFLDGDGGRRLLVVGTGTEPAAGDAAGKAWRHSVARLLTSGENHAVIDLTGLSFDADAAARVALAAALRGWRYDRYRTRSRTSRSRRSTAVTIVGARRGRAAALGSALAPVVEGVP